MGGEGGFSEIKMSFMEISSMHTKASLEGKEQDREEEQNCIGHFFLDEEHLYN